MNDTVEALKIIGSLCRIVFDNEEAFCKQFNIKLNCTEEFTNVSFSGKMCHILEVSAYGNKNHYVNAQDVLYWIDSLTKED